MSSSRVDLTVSAVDTESDVFVFLRDTQDDLYVRQPLSATKVPPSVTVADAASQLTTLQFCTKFRLLFVQQADSIALYDARLTEDIVPASSALRGTIVCPTRLLGFRICNDDRFVVIAVEKKLHVFSLDSLLSVSSSLSPYYTIDVASGLASLLWLPSSTLLVLDRDGRLTKHAVDQRHSGEFADCNSAIGLASSLNGSHVCVLGSNNTISFYDAMSRSLLHTSTLAPGEDMENAKFTNVYWCPKDWILVSGVTDAGDQLGPFYVFLKVVGSGTSLAVQSDPDVTKTVEVGDLLPLTAAKFAPLAASLTLFDSSMFALTYHRTSVRSFYTFSPDSLFEVDLADEFRLYTGDIVGMSLYWPAEKDFPPRAERPDERTRPHAVLAVHATDGEVYTASLFHQSLSDEKERLVEEIRMSVSRTQVPFTGSLGSRTLELLSSQPVSSLSAPAPLTNLSRTAAHTSLPVVESPTNSDSDNNFSPLEAPKRRGPVASFSNAPESSSAPTAPSASAASKPPVFGSTATSSTNPFGLAPSSQPPFAFPASSVSKPVAAAAAPPVSSASPFSFGSSLVAPTAEKPTPPNVFAFGSSATQPSDKNSAVNPFSSNVGQPPMGNIVSSTTNPFGLPQSQVSVPSEKVPAISAAPAPQGQVSTAQEKAPVINPFGPTAALGPGSAPASKAPPVDPFATKTVPFGSQGSSTTSKTESSQSAFQLGGGVGSANVAKPSQPFNFGVSAVSNPMTGEVSETGKADRSAAAVAPPMVDKISPAQATAATKPVPKFYDQFPAGPLRDLAQGVVKTLEELTVSHPGSLSMVPLPKLQAVDIASADRNLDVVVDRLHSICASLDMWKSEKDELQLVMDMQQLNTSENIYVHQIDSFKNRITKIQSGLDRLIMELDIKMSADWRKALYGQVYEKFTEAVNLDRQVKQLADDIAELERQANQTRQHGPHSFKFDEDEGNDAGAEAPVCVAEILKTPLLDNADGPHGTGIPLADMYRLRGAQRLSEVALLQAKVVARSHLTTTSSDTPLMSRGSSVSGAVVFGGSQTPTVANEANVPKTAQNVVSKSESKPLDLAPSATSSLPVAAVAPFSNAPSEPAAKKTVSGATLLASSSSFGVTVPSFAAAGTKKPADTATNPPTSSNKPFAFSASPSHGEPTKGIAISDIAKQPTSSGDVPKSSPFPGFALSATPSQPGAAPVDSKPLFGVQPSEANAKHVQPPFSFGGSSASLKPVVSETLSKPIGTASEAQKSNDSASAGSVSAEKMPNVDSSDAKSAESALSNATPFSSKPSPTPLGNVAAAPLPSSNSAVIPGLTAAASASDTKSATGSSLPSIPATPVVTKEVAKPVTLAAASPFANLPAAPITVGTTTGSAAPSTAPAFSNLAANLLAGKTEKPVTTSSAPASSGFSTMSSLTSSLNPPIASSSGVAPVQSSPFSTTLAAAPTSAAGGTPLPTLAASTLTVPSLSQSNVGFSQPQPFSATASTVAPASGFGAPTSFGTPSAFGQSQLGNRTNPLMQKAGAFPAASTASSPGLSGAPIGGTPQRQVGSGFASFANQSTFGSPATSTFGAPAPAAQTSGQPVGSGFSQFNQNSGVGTFGQQPLPFAQTSQPPMGSQGSSFGQSSFGQSSSFGGGQPAFGQPSGQTAFGQQPLGQSSGQPAFGQSSFGQPSGQSAFGQPALGQPALGQAIGLGQPSLAASPFGQSSFGQQLGGSSQLGNAAPLGNSLLPGGAWPQSQQPTQQPQAFASTGLFGQTMPQGGFPSGQVQNQNPFGQR